MWLCLKVCCCTGLAVSGNRYMVQTWVCRANDACDVCIIRCRGAFKNLGIFLNSLERRSCSEDCRELLGIRSKETSSDARLVRPGAPTGEYRIVKVEYLVSGAYFWDFLEFKQSIERTRANALAQVLGAPRSLFLGLS